jgi:hypothetical protein
MKITLPLAAVLFVGSASLAAVQALPSASDVSSNGVVQIAAKSAKAKSAKTGKMAKVTKKPKTKM